MASRYILRYWELFLVLLFSVSSSRAAVNIALSGIASQSSEQDVNRWPASNAINGCTSQDITSDCCSHTRAGQFKQAWWRVKLGVLWTIDYITIYYRSNSGYRFGGYSLYVSNSTTIPPQGILCYKDNSSFWTGVSLNPTHKCPSVARYVTVYNRRETPKTRDWYDDYAVLELCEVQVFACPTGTYGSGNCNNNCSASCFGGNCNAVSGHCFYCFPGKYGDLCQQICVPNCNTSCEKDSGHCIGCIAGKTGDLCSDSCQGNCVSCSQSSATDCYECINGKHGDSCQLDCSNNCKVSTCTKDEGFCIGECVDGKYGDICEIDCPSGCQGECTKDNGYCTECIPGKRGNQCNVDCSASCAICSQLTDECFECVNGKHGTMCEIDCSVNCRDRLCEKDNGHCIECLTGFYGSYCNMGCPDGCKDTCDRNAGTCTACKDGKYGSTCDRKCPSQCLNGRCIQLQGKCEGCVEGVHGDNCTRTCPDHCIGNTCLQENGHCLDYTNIAAIGIGAGCGLVILVLVVVVIVLVRRISGSQSDSRNPSHVTDITEMDSRQKSGKDATYYEIGESGPHEVDSDRYEGLDHRTVEQPHANETVQRHLYSNQ